VSKEIPIDPTLCYVTYVLSQNGTVTGAGSQGFVGALRWVRFVGARQLFWEQLCSCPVAGTRALIFGVGKIKNLISFEIKMIFFNVEFVCTNVKTKKKVSWPV
jgi:hypothetical protein